MIEVKTSELIGPALDWAVAQAAGWPVEVVANSTYSDASTGHKAKATGYRLWMVSDVDPEECMPSTDWSQGGPLIERYRVSIVYSDEECEPCAWTEETSALSGSTTLIAACRAIVAAHLGDTVQIPDELAAGPALAGVQA